MPTPAPEATARQLTPASSLGHPEERHHLAADRRPARLQWTPDPSSSDDVEVSSIKAEEKPIVKIFCNDYNFVIPAYQRPYAWGVEQSEQLFDDLWTAMIEAGEDGDPYFLGSIVLIKDDSSEAQVVDGQQRLATLAILLAAIRNRLPKDRQHEVEAYLRQKGTRILKTKDRFRFTPRDRDRDFFHRDIIGDGGLRADVDPAQLTDSQRNMWRNAVYFRDRLAISSDDDVEDFTSFILQKCFLVVVATSNFDAAYRIFSVLNDRGLDLQPTDILKAKLIGDIAEAERSRYNARWETIEVDLGRELFLEVFVHIRTIHRKVKPKKNLLDEYKEHILPGLRPEAFIEEQLIPYANALQVLRDACYLASAGAERVNGVLRALHLIPNFDWLPPAMQMYQKHQSNAEQLACWLERLERLAASLMLRRQSVNVRLERYARVLDGLEKGDDLGNAESALELSLDERKETRRILNEPIYGTTAARPLLLRLDQLLVDEGSRYDHSVISIEHVLPQTPPPGSEWLVLFPDEGQRSAWTHRLGNLVLLSRRKNSRASNYDFEKKKQTYFKQDKVSSFALTTEVLAVPHWTPAALEDRQARLLKVLEDAWQLA